jgi:hypothetical protein
MCFRSITAGALICLWTSGISAQDTEVRLDGWGNPIGEKYGLAGKGNFKGKRLLVWSGEPDHVKYMFPDSNPLWIALRKRGFKVDIRPGAFDARWLSGADQLWVFSGGTMCMSAEDSKAVEAFVEKGKGLYLIADNAPYLQEANFLANRLFGASISGDYAGGKLIAVDESMADDNRGKESQLGGRPSSNNQGTSPERGAKLPNLGQRMGQIVSHSVARHAILTDINIIYEGITISHISGTDRLQVFLTASDGQPLAAVARDPRLRVVVDCGWTRYYGVPPVDYVTKTAGTIRYAENIAAYLSRGGSKRFTANQIAPMRGDVFALLSALEEADASIRRQIIAELDETSPTYSQVADRLEQIVSLSRSEEKAVAAAARNQLVNAFQRAPISQCLRWLGRAEADLQELIWEQVDERIGRADETRRGGYRDSAVAVLGSDQSSVDSRKAALDLLVRLKDRAAVPGIVETLVQLPRELWAPAGDALRQLTGQDFGPSQGAGIDDVADARKKWRSWWKDIGGK